MNFTELAQKYQTPLYAYDFDKLTASYNELKDVFKARKSIINYAVKSNSNMSVIKHFANLGSGADCVSIGEVRRALLAGIPKYKIIFSGVGKKDEEIREALKEGILFINLESEAEMRRVDMIAKELNITARISVRVNPNIDPKTHPYISTGLHENKFGVDLDTAKRMYIFAKNSNFLDPVGVHFHIGSQLTELQPLVDASDIVSNLVRTLKALKINIKFYDIGGGLGVVYDNETLIDTHIYAQSILATLIGLDVTVMMEPGRFLTANAGYFLTKVLYEKVNGDKRFVIVDGAMNDLLRPSLYNAYHSVALVGKENQKIVGKADIVGPVCESGDFLAKNVELPIMKHEDLIIINSVGAYGFAMSGNYNTRGRVAEVAVENGNDRLIRRRETFEDIIALEKDLMV